MVRPWQHSQAAPDSGGTSRSEVDFQNHARCIISELFDDDQTLRDLKPDPILDFPTGMIEDVEVSVVWDSVISEVLLLID